jgi:hypothetical protein
MSAKGGKKRRNCPNESGLYLCGAAIASARSRANAAPRQKQKRDHHGPAGGWLERALRIEPGHRVGKEWETRDERSEGKAVRELHTERGVRSSLFHRGQRTLEPRSYSIAMRGAERLQSHHACLFANKRRFGCARGDGLDRRRAVDRS